MEKTKLWNFVKVLVFNVAEAIVIFLLGKLFGVDVSIRIMFMVTFFCTRMVIGSPKHYNKAYRCAVWSCLVFLSLYLLSTLDLLATIMLTIFTAFISTGKADIDGAFMWKGKESKYSDIDEYIKYNEYDNKLIEFEKKVKEKADLDFLIYKYRFKENLTFEEIGDRLDIPTNRITEKLDRIAFTLRLYCGI